MPWLLDGNNLAQGGDRERVRRAALDLARRERLRVLLYFDGAPPQGSPPVQRLGAVEVRYVPHADSAILDELRGGGRGWRLATDDRALATRARATGAEVVVAERFWARVRAGGAGDEARVGAGEVAGGSLEGVERLVEGARRVPRRPPGRRRR